MDKEVDPTVLAVINEKRLSGPRLTPVEIVAKMGVFDAREKPFDYAWLASGDSVIATIWAEYVSVGAGGRWFYVESLDTQYRAGGGTRSPNQVQRAKDRLALLKRTFDGEQEFRAVLQTNRVAIDELESNRSAKVSTRVRDDSAWHVAAWEPKKGFAILVRGARGWAPTADEIQAVQARRGVPAESAAGAEGSGDSSPEGVHAAALAYVIRHFSGYGHRVEDVTAQQRGYDLEVTSAKGVALLRVVVKGTTAEVPRFQLTQAESACALREPLWRLLLVTDALGPAMQHRVYKPDEMAQAPGFQAPD